MHNDLHYVDILSNNSIHENISNSTSKLPSKETLAHISTITRSKSSISDSNIEDKQSKKSVHDQSNVPTIPTRVSTNVVQSPPVKHDELEVSKTLNVTDIKDDSSVKSFGKNTENQVSAEGFMIVETKKFWKTTDENSKKDHDENKPKTLKQIQASLHEKKEFYDFANFSQVCRVLEKMERDGNTKKKMSMLVVRQHFNKLLEIEEAKYQDMLKEDESNEAFGIVDPDLDRKIEAWQQINRDQTNEYISDDVLEDFKIV